MANIYGMDVPRLQEESFNYCGTTIYLIQKYSYEVMDYVDNKVDFIVVGKNEQKMLNNQGEPDLMVGYLYNAGNDLHMKKKKADSASDDDSCVTFDFSYRKKQNQKDIFTMRMDSRVMHIVEPCLGREEEYWNNEKRKVEQGFVYNARRVSKRVSMGGSFCFELHGKDAIEEAEKDLALCYKNSLEELVRWRRMELFRTSVALFNISTGVGFPRGEAVCIAVKSICEFIQKNQNVYSSIYFIMKKNRSLCWVKNCLNTMWHCVNITQLIMIFTQSVS
jgi:hypothetical protein